jgi:AhpD family alkylhydroperoxidase
MKAAGKSLNALWRIPMLKARMKHPAMLVPGAMEALQMFHKAAEHGTVPAKTHKLIQLRASQINGCSVCVEMHALELKKLGDTDERIFAVSAWHESPRFDDAERAALALTEAATRLADRADPVSDEIWAEAAKHYSEPELASIVLSIAGINLWNRLNATIKQPAMGIPKG